MRHNGYVEKGWGHEFIFATNDMYCGKLLEFRSGAKFSMHFHAQKDETWYVLSGKFVVYWIDTNSAETNSRILDRGAVWRNPPLLPHQLECIEAGTIVEVSSPDSIKDNYRVLPGDSQQK
jgi:mannose-6-phosphate isomerase-like protein (cupin superfamily)